MDKKWIVRSRQILNLLNSLSNCKEAANKSQVDFDIKKRAKEFKDPSKITKYVEKGYKNVEMLFEILWNNWDNWELVYSSCLYFIKNGVDPIEFLFAFGSVLNNKREKPYYKMQPVYDVFSEKFLGIPNEDLDVQGLTDKLRGDVSSIFY